MTTTTLAHDPTAPPARLAPWLVRLAGAWLATGALMKLLLGSPADLPSVIRSLPLDLALTYRVSIAVELAVASLAFLAPRLAWPLVTAVFGVFVAILVGLIATGAASCGCFGPNVTLPPWVMLAIDGALLIAMLASRPWRIARSTLSPGLGRLRAAAVVLAVAVSVGAPFALDRQAKGAVAAGDDGGQAALPSYAVLSPAKWVGKPLADSELARWLDLSRLPQDGLFVFYRQTCEHCAAHLFELAANEQGDRAVVLVRVVDKTDTAANNVIQVKPQGPYVSEVELSGGIDWVVTTPADAVIEQGIVVSAQEGIGS